MGALCSGLTLSLPMGSCSVFPPGLQVPAAPEQTAASFVVVCAGRQTLVPRQIPIPSPFLTYAPQDNVVL